MASLHEQVAASVQADIDACRVTRVFAPADPPDELLPAVASVADAYRVQAAAVLAPQQLRRHPLPHPQPAIGCSV